MIAETGARVLVRSLEAQGVQYVFGIPGSRIDKVFDTPAIHKLNARPSLRFPCDSPAILGYILGASIRALSS